MNQYRRVGAFPRIFLLLLLVLVLVAGGVLWFDYLGLIDARGALAPVFGLFGADEPIPPEQRDDPLLLDSARLGKEMESLDLLRDELSTREAELDTRAAELSQRAAELEELEAALTERENSFNQTVRSYDDRRANLIQNSQYLRSMPPANAVAILENWDDQLIIDVMRITDELAAEAGEFSLTSEWLRQMDADRADDILRKMTIKPSSAS